MFIQDVYSLWIGGFVMNEQYVSVGIWKEKEMKESSPRNIDHLVVHSLMWWG